MIKNWLKTGQNWLELVFLPYLELQPCGQAPFAWRLPRITTTPSTTLHHHQKHHITINNTASPHCPHQQPHKPMNTTQAAQKVPVHHLGRYVSFIITSTKCFFFFTNCLFLGFLFLLLSTSPTPGPCPMPPLWASACRTATGSVLALQHPWSVTTTWPWQQDNSKHHCHVT